MIKVTITVDTDKGAGYVTFLTSNDETLHNFIESFESVCNDTYEWYKITSIEKKSVDENNWGEHEIH